MKIENVGLAGCYRIKTDSDREVNLSKKNILKWVVD